MQCYFSGEKEMRKRRPCLCEQLIHHMSLKASYYLRWAGWSSWLCQAVDKLDLMVWLHSIEITHVGQFLRSGFLWAFGVTFESHSSFPRVLDKIPTYCGTVRASALKSESLPTDFPGELDVLETTTPVSATAILAIGSTPVAILRYPDLCQRLTVDST